MKSSATLWTMVMMTMLLAGCAGTKPPMPETFPQRYSDPNIVLGWNCIRTAGGVTAEGVAMSPQRLKLTDVQFTLYGVDAQGAQVSQLKEAPQVYGVTEPTPFIVKHESVGGEVHYDLAFTYKIGEGSGKGGSDTSPQNGRKEDACSALR